MSQKFNRNREPRSRESKSGSVDISSIQNEKIQMRGRYEDMKNDHKKMQNDMGGRRKHTHTQTLEVFYEMHNENKDT